MKYKKMRLWIIQLMLICGLGTTVFANNVQVSNIEVFSIDRTNQLIYIQFDLSGENAWRTTGGAQNWDANWIFVKYRSGSGDWRHATLSTISTDYHSPDEAQIDPVTDGKGVFVYASDANIGNISSYNYQHIVLAWEYGVDGFDEANTTDLEVRIFAIEMVYIPQGSFYVGSGGSETNAFYTFGTTNPYFINSESEIQVGNTNGQLYYPNSNSNGGDQSGPIPANFPKGFNAFYCMKYEISQQQYVDFLNTLNRVQQNNRTASDVTNDNIVNAFVMSDANTVQARNGISCSLSGNGTTQPILFYCDLNGNGAGNEIDDGQNLACGYLIWDDGLAFFDWAGLRPLSELEFEKSCRGVNIPTSNEYAWGTTESLESSTTLINNGKQSEQTSNSGNGLCNYNNDGFGPMRCGFTATTGTNRITAGASYYGLLEMSGNLSERFITVGNSDGRNYTALHGDGVISNSGNADVSNWPNSQGQSNRGGNYRRVANRLAISGREFGAYSFNTRFSNAGWRGGR